MPRNFDSLKLTPLSQSIKYNRSNLLSFCFKLIFFLNHVIFFKLMKYQTSTKSTALARLSLTAQHLHLSRCSSTSATPDIIPINQGTKFTPDYTNYATTLLMGKLCLISMILH